MSDIYYKIQLNCGTTIELQRLLQYKTYRSVMEGIPRKKYNNELIEKAMQELLGFGTKCYLIQPIEKPINIACKVYERLGENYQPLELPKVTCVSEFRSYSKARDPNADYSDLNIVWFQNTFSLPIESSVLQDIHALDWQAYAVDRYWDDF